MNFWKLKMDGQSRKTFFESWEVISQCMAFVPKVFEMAAQPWETVPRVLEMRFVFGKTFPDPGNYP
jgi:hypothetical protein